LGGGGGSYNSGSNPSDIAAYQSGNGQVVISWLVQANCTPAPRTSVTVTVNSSVAGSIAGGGITVCPGTNNTLLTLSGYTGSIQWQSSSDNISFSNIVGATSDTYTALNLSSTTYYRVVVTAGSCTPANSASVAVNVSVVPTPSLTGPLAVCLPATGIVYTTDGGYSNYVWTISAGGTITSGDGTNSITVDWNTVGNQSLGISYTISSGCTASGTNGIVTTNPPADPNPVTATPPEICGSGTSNLNATSVGNTIYWYTQPSGGNVLGTSLSGVDFPVSPVVTTTYYAEAQIQTGISSQTFNYTGTMQTFTVPNGVYSVNIDCYGAGGIGVNYTPGKGGRAKGDLAVTPGQVLNLYVGGQSLFNGGGAGQMGANGGDATDVRLGGTALANRAIVAGGGGGAGGDNWQCNSGNANGGGGTAGSNYVGGGGGKGYGFCGGDGGLNGGGSGYHSFGGGGGGGGGLNSGGAGAASQGGTAGSGTLGQGGASYNSPSCYSGTGGGGGGYYGGGGAAGSNCGAGMGGGGSSWAGTLLNPYFQSGVQTGNGHLVLTWNLPNPNCSPSARVPVVITVNPAASGGTISPANASVCPGNNSTLITLSGNTGTIQWQSSPDNISFTNIAGETGSTYTALNLLSTAYYRAKVISGNCAPVYSNVATVNVSIVNPTFTAGPTSVCVGSTGNIYTTQGGMSNYIWTVSAGGSITSGGTPSDNTVTVTWNTVGAQTVSVNYTNGTGCTAASATVRNVTVNALAAPTFTNGVATACVGSTGNFYATQYGYSGYAWTISAGGTITSGGNGYYYAYVTWNTAGAQSISVNYSNAANCAAASPTVFDVTVLPAPAPTLGGPNVVCLNSSGNVYTTESGKTNYSWSISNGYATAGGNGSNTITVTWTGSGAQTISVNYSNGGCYAPSATVYNVTVNPLPAPSITGPASACNGSSGNTYFTESGKNGYTWTIAGGTINSGAGTNSVNVTWTSAGTQWIRVNYTDANGCTPGSATQKNVTVFALPVPTITGSTALCLNSTTTYSTESGMSGYNWSIVGGNINSGQGSNSVSVTWNTIGSQSISVTYVDGNSCAPLSSTTKNVTVSSVPVPTISGPASACLNVAGNVYTTQGGMTNYTWSIIGGTITSGGGTGSSSATVTWTSTGSKSISVNYTNNGCTGASPFVYNVTVNPLPTPTIDGPTSACVLSAGNLYTTEAGMTNYTWTLNGGIINSGSATNSVSVTWTASGSKWIRVNYTNANGCTAVAATQYDVTVNPLPVPTISGPTPVCNGSTGNVYATEAGMTGYTWTINGGVINSGSSTNSVDVTWNTVGGEWIKVNYTNGNGCSASSPTQKTVIVNANLPVSVIIAASANPSCTGASVTYTATPTNGGGSPSYLWKVNGVDQVGNSNTYSYVPVTGDLVTCILTSSLTCQSGGPATSNTINQTVNPVYAVNVSIAESQNNVCAGTSVTFTATPTNPGPSPTYHWFKNGVQVGSNSSTYTYTPAHNDEVYCTLTSSYPCTTGSPATSNTVTMTVNTSYPVSLSIAPDHNNVCSGTAVTFTATPTNGGSTPGYQWYKNSVLVAGETNPTYTYTPSNNDHVYCVLTSNQSCPTGNPATSNTITMTVNPVLAASVSVAPSQNPVCEGSSVTFIASP
ncbi:MAG: hypothetical protein WCO84_05955, partial [bacterium]